MGPLRRAPRCARSAGSPGWRAGRRCAGLHPSRRPAHGFAEMPAPMPAHGCAQMPAPAAAAAAAGAGAAVADPWTLPRHRPARAPTATTRPRRSSPRSRPARVPTATTSLPPRPPPAPAPTRPRPSCPRRRRSRSRHRPAPTRGRGRGLRGGWSGTPRRPRAGPAPRRTRPPATPRICCPHGPSRSATGRPWTPATSAAPRCRRRCRRSDTPACPR
mmetsp:Transcript_116597/g.324171  ORF Transcript_116597/g.324171 Transcript_116597/m.324171 type:complete len:216 (-) Transcript_116597:85-732(-)